MALAADAVVAIRQHVLGPVRVHWPADPLTRRPAAAVSGRWFPVAQPDRAQDS